MLSSNYWQWNQELEYDWLLLHHNQFRLVLKRAHYAYAYGDAEAIRIREDFMSMLMMGGEL